MSRSLHYIKTSNDIWPAHQAKRVHKKLINKHWKKEDIVKGEPLIEFDHQNRSNHQILDITWDIRSVSHLLKRTVTGANLEEIHTFINNGMETSIQGLLAEQ